MIDTKLKFVYYNLQLKFTKLDSLLEDLFVKKTDNWVLGLVNLISLVKGKVAYIQLHKRLVKTSWNVNLDVLSYYQTEV